MTTLDEKALESVARALCPIDPNSDTEHTSNGKWYPAEIPHWKSWVGEAHAAIAAYLSAIIPEDVAALVRELRQLATMPTKVVQIARGNIFEDAATALQALAVENAKLTEQCFALGAEIKALRGDAARKADGFVMVPVEPTDAMIDAGLSADPEFITEVWRAMISAAPDPLVKVEVIRKAGGE